MSNCYCCKQERRCCGGPLHLMKTETHEGHTIEVEEDLKKMWGLGRVVRNCRGIQGKYEDVETGVWSFVFLGHTRDKVIKGMNHVKSFLWCNLTSDYFKTLFCKICFFRLDAVKINKCKLGVGEGVKKIKVLCHVTSWTLCSLCSVLSVKPLLCRRCGAKKTV